MNIFAKNYIKQPLCVLIILSFLLQLIPLQAQAGVIDDVWEYLKRFEVSYCTVYDLGYDRTGCVFCMFGMQMEKEDRFEKLKQTHPKLYNFCMDKLGLREVIAFIKQGKNE